MMPSWAAAEADAGQKLVDDHSPDAPRYFFHAPYILNRAHQPSTLIYPRFRGDDQRLKYILYFLDVRGARVLELGPFEGHHTILLDKMGAREIVGLEARADNVVKCQWTRSQYELTNAQFHMVDIGALYRGELPMPVAGGFDLLFCLGWLYHVPDPGRALAWCCGLAPTLFLGTHYVETCADRALPGQDEEYRYGNRTYRVRRFSDGGPDDPLAGLSPFSRWLFRDDLVRLLHNCGYHQVHVLGRDLQAGLPHVTILAQRGTSS